MLVVIPVCGRDLALATLNLQLAAKLDARCPFPALISAPTGIDLTELESLAAKWFASISTFRYSDWKGDRTWPRPQNWAWQETARHIATLKPEQPWFWWEADATPIKSGWFDTFATAYGTGNKPFSGHFVGKNGNKQQTSGVAIYPPDVRPYSANAFLARSNPFDCVLATDAPNHISSLSGIIGHYFKPVGRPSFVATPEEVANLRSSSLVFFHGSSDGSLVKAMLGLKMEPAKVELPKTSPVTTIVTQSSSRTFFHSGDLGDIIYSFPYLRSLGAPVHLFIGPDPRSGTREPMTLNKFNWLAPLLVRQPYIKRVEYCDQPPMVDCNLNDFRKTWNAPHNAKRTEKRLYLAYFEHFNAKIPENVSEPWLVSDTSPDTLHPVVIARSPRYQNPRFPWQKVAAAYKDRMIFVGLPTEHRTWTLNFGNACVPREAIDAMDMASIIKGARLFIGNQSFPMALALGLGVPTIQETSPQHHDSIINGRQNAQFTDKSIDIQLPDIRPVEYVSIKLKESIRLGPFIGAPGIGDTIMVTPLARALGRRAIMCLPPSMERLAFLFHKLCPVEITENCPFFHFQTGGLQSAELLKTFGFPNVDPIPSINIARTDAKKAFEILKPYSNPIAFNPTCAHHYVNIRQQSPTFWSPIIAHLRSKGFTVLQFGQRDYPTLNGVQRPPFVPLPLLAALYKQIGRYVGVHTGDHHLMTAVGGKVIVAEPVPWNEEKFWTYNAPNRIGYAKLNDFRSVIDKIEKLLCD